MQPIKVNNLGVFGKSAFLGSGTRVVAVRSVHAPRQLFLGQESLQVGATREKARQALGMFERIAKAYEKLSAFAGPDTAGAMYDQAASALKSAEDALAQARKT